MKKYTLTKSSLAFLLFTLFFAAPQFAHSTVVYTDIVDEVLTSTHSIDMDMDNNGSIEFTIDDMGFGGATEAGTFFDPTLVNFVTWSAGLDWDVFKPVPLGTNINVNSGFYAQADCYVNPFWVDPSHIIPNNTDIYIGMWFKIGANTHYGWIRVNVPSNGQLIVKDYAYDDAANTGIDAGDIGATNPILVNSITVNGTGGASAITVSSGTLQMLETVLPANATDQTVTWSVIPGTGNATISLGGLLTATADGTVTVRATANDGSNVFGDKMITISNQTTGSNSIEAEAQEMELFVYPNPCSSFLNIRLMNDVQEVVVYDFTGRIVHRATPQNNNTEMQLPVDHLQNGVYRVQAIGSHSSYHTSFVKTR